MIKKIFIEGMSCEHCVNHVSIALKDLSSVKNVEVHLANNFAVLEALQNISDEEIKSAIEDAGYEVTKIEAQAL
jgi:copper chaperone CopZ